MTENIPPEFENYSIALPNFLKQAVNLFVTYGALIILILLISEMLATEYEGRSILLLFTQPLNRAHIITTKMGSALLGYFIVFIGLIGASVSIGKLLGTDGSFQYPVIFEQDGNLQLMTIYDYMQKIIILHIIVIIFVTTLYLFFSLLIKQTLPTLFTLIGTLLAGYALTTFLPWKSLAWVNPFMSMLPADAILYQNNQVWYQAVPITMVVAIVLYVISMMIIRNSKVE
ncbi:hypothetical protein [Paracerasibacillus soli]|uniref:ABC transporter permease n=1 Tax=Paracerasibacillus soli TaxID=480284 RepID=A0ABU5CNU5_9BACI|nr:hypothetical protein [Virgibacillus soli]MDY0407900.1 hypothetical protein [Virgibacillus soli]